MKKLTFLLAFLAVSVMSFAQGRITYVLNGGITNDLGWENPQDMYETLNADWNAFSGTDRVWTPLAELPSDPAKGIPTEASGIDVPFLADANFVAHFQWLIEYMDAMCTEQGKILASTSSAYLRYNLASFFKNTVRSGWPQSADYTTIGVSNYGAYKDYWKRAYANPTEPTGVFELNEL